MESSKLKKIIENHQHWVNEDFEGWKGMKADLHGANLQGAELHDANLEGAELHDANLKGADLDANERIRKGLVLNEDLTVYKKLRDDVIATLRIPKGNIVFSINNDKCRTQSAYVVKLSEGTEGVSYYNGNFIYKVGETIVADNFCCEYNVECGEGIHFYRTKAEAEKFKWV